MVDAVEISWFLLLLGFSSFHGFYAQIPPNISLGSSIVAGSNSSWRSLSGDFAFGFHPLASGLYLVGIWFDKIPERTLIWSANRDRPAEQGSTVRLTLPGQLELRYVNGSTQLIYSGSVAASLGFMQNDGNFVLRDANSLSIWESFGFPTDTLLPGQVVRGLQNQKLYSNRKGTVDYSTGNFMLQMQYDGNLVLSAYRFSDPGYWYTGTIFNNVTLVFDNTTSLMYLVNASYVNIYNLTKNMSAPVEDYYHRAAIDDHGNFQQYVHRKVNGKKWERVWRAFEEPCWVNSICGVYGFCTSPDNETVSCSCLPGYIPLDPVDVSRGCRPEIVLNYCADRGMRNFTVEVIDDADFPFESFADLARVRNVDVEGCKRAMMDDCYAMAAALKDSRCIKKRMPLLNARKSPSTKGIKALIKVPIKIKDPRTPPRKNSDDRTYLAAGFITSGVLALLSAGFAVYYHPFARRLVKRKRFNNTNAIGINFRQFTFQELHEATNGFSKILGRGSSGTVYRGSLTSRDVNIDIAVKQLKTKAMEKESENEFLTELKIIGRTHHKNLVRLLGFCLEDGHRILVYEVMKNGTLSDHLFGKEGEKPMWSQRAEMALGIARGLLYLHEECETQIIHCDIKPQNVLLDDNGTAKIADFGLSKLLNKEQTKTVTNVRGTMGYLAPEWLRNAAVTAKVDVYSYGVMLLEIICCRRHIELSRVEEESEDADLVIIDWVLSCMVSGKLEKLVSHDSEVMDDFKRFERMALVGLWCVHPDPILRPSMKKVTQMLEGGNVEVGVPPLLYEHMVEG